MVLFCNWRIKPDILIDIKPECGSAICGDFLKYNLSYVPGTLVIGNPPYGARMNMARSFYNKSVLIADYIGFILPITQLNNKTSLYKFDLIYSEDLGMKKYSDRDLHCCFNLYRRPDYNVRFERDNFNGIIIYRYDNKIYDSITDFDVRMCYYGNGSVGKILFEGEKYSAEYKIKIDDRHPQKQEIIRILKETNWKEKVSRISMACLKQHDIFDELRNKGIKEYTSKLQLF